MSTSSIAEYFEREGELTVTGNNSPLLLLGSKNVWFIKSGSIDVFSVIKEGTEVKGARIYLFSVSSGNILFGMEEESDRSFLAVGNTNVHIYKLEFDPLLCFLKDSDNLSAFSLLLDKWLLSLTAGVARDVSLRYDIALEKSNNLVIPENKKIRARKGVLWLRIQAGCLTMIDSDINEFNGGKYFPVTENSWCMTIRQVTISPLTTEELLNEDLFFEYLKFYHTQVLALEELNVRMLMVDDFVRNKEKIKILEKVEKAAWGNIAGVLDDSPKTDTELKTKGMLLEACRILCRYLGIKISEPLTDAQKTPGLNEIAQSSKFEYRKITLNHGWWKTNSGPMLAFIGDNDPVVLIPGASGSYKVKIPSKQTETKLTTEIAEQIGNYAYTFYKPFPFKQITPIEFLKFIYQSCKKEFLFMVAAGTVGGLLTLFIPLLTGIIIDSVIPQSDRLRLYGFGLAIVFSVIALIFAQIIRSLSYLRLDTKIDYLIQSALWDRLIHLPVSFFKKFSSGELAAKANSIARLKQILTYSVLNTVIYNFFMIFNLFILFYYDLLLGFLSSGLFLIYLAVILAASIKIKKKNFRIIQYENRITSFINQVLNSISKIKIAGTEKLAFKMWTDKYSLKQKENLNVKRTSNFVIILNSVFPLFAIIFIFYMFSLESYRGLSAGTLIAFLTAFNIFLLSVVQISNASVLFFMSIPLYDNSKEILYTLPEYAAAKEDIKELRGEIELNHVYFRYSKEGKYILSDISLNIKPGEFIAIVGTSGSGKSTLMRLLLGFETPEMGAVYYDKHNVDSIDISSLRRQVGTVLQNSRLFPGNIYSNIAGVGNFAVDDVIEAAKMVGLDEDLKTMPMGVFTYVNEGVSTLSGGQRQKILLAKALINRPAVILLDEATSALDNESQNIVTDTLEKIQATRIIVAHRLSTVKFADRIYVLEKGKIAEYGTYEELMGREEKFTELVKRQLAEV
jgi:NHLM bacteriocin system ABC transporter ATP-binding protein